MPDDSPQLTVTLPAADWQVLLTGLYELPMKHSAAVANRLQLALAAAQKPAEIPHIVKGGKP
jgi:hypothetical protein